MKSQKIILHPNSYLQRKNFKILTKRSEQSWPGNRLPSRLLALFFRQLATLLSSGIAIIQCIDILAQSQINPAFSTILLNIKYDLESGKNLSRAMANYKNIFSDFHCQLIYLGETTGTLDIMLHKITNHLEKKIIFRNKLIQALFYPCFIVITAMLVSLLLLIFVIPHFAELFQNMHSQIPFITRIILGSSLFLRGHGWQIIILFSLLVLCGFHPVINLSLKRCIKKLFSKLPIINNFKHKMALTHFLQNLVIVLTAGIPIAAAIPLASEAMDASLTEALQFTQLRIAAGEQLHQALQDKRLFPTMLVQLIKIGEESGTLETMLAKIAEIYESDIEQFLEQLSQLLEPLIMIVLGVLIGGLVMAMYLPIFKLGTVL